MTSADPDLRSSFPPQLLNDALHAKVWKIQKESRALNDWIITKALSCERHTRRLSMAHKHGKE